MTFEIYSSAHLQCENYDETTIIHEQDDFITVLVTCASANNVNECKFAFCKCKLRVMTQ